MQLCKLQSFCFVSLELKIKYKLILVIIISIGAFLLFNENKEEKLRAELSGSWAVDTLVVDSIDITGCLSGNWLNLYYDELANIPVTKDRCKGLESYINRASWQVEILNDSVYLTFVTNNEFFNGKYKHFKL